MQTTAAATPPSFFTTFVKSAALGSGWCAGIYCVLRLFKSKDSLPPIQSFALSGAFQSGLNVIATKIYEVGFGLLGEDNAHDEAGKAIGSRLRQCCWKVIHSVDGILNKIDAFVSGKLGIRTAKKLNIHYAQVRVMVELNKEEEQIQLVHKGSKPLSILEIMRFVFWKSVTLTAQGMVVGNLSSRAVEKIGYQPIGAKEHIGPEALVANKGIHIRFVSNFIFNFALKIMLTMHKHINDVETNQRSEKLRQSLVQLRRFKEEALQQFLLNSKLDPELKSVLERNEELLSLVRLNPRLQDLLKHRLNLLPFLTKNEQVVQSLLIQNPTLQAFLLEDLSAQKELAQNQTLQNILIGYES